MVLGGEGVAGLFLLMNEYGVSLSSLIDDPSKKLSASVSSKLLLADFGLRFRLTPYLSNVAWLGDVGEFSAFGRSGYLQAAKSTGMGT